MELYYGYIGEENLRKKRNKLKKLKGCGTCVDGWEKWGDIWVIFPKVKNIFDFTFYII